MGAQHTAGPWSYVENPSHFGFENIVDARDHIVAKPMRMGVEGVMAANAHLIAAAPDLLKAVTDWINWLSPQSEWRDDAADYEAAMLDAMRAAIAKAQGGAA